MRSHPPTLATLVRRCLTTEVRLDKAARVLVAVSGGPDSMAMLDVLATLAPRLDFAVVAHGVDHGLRAEAAAELDVAERFAGSLGVPFARTRVALRPGGNLQARAREARYRALEAAMQSAQCTYLATAHHADDRAETVLLRLLRGAGASGLGVLAPISERRIRPLVRARRRDVLTHVERHGIPFSSDPSNESPRFLRVRVRRELMPLLEALSPSIVTHLCALADELGAATPEHGGFALPRATQEALVTLAATRKGEVRLAGDLVVRASDRLRPAARPSAGPAHREET